MRFRVSLLLQRMRIVRFFEREKDLRLLQKFRGLYSQRFSPSPLAHGCSRNLSSNDQFRSNSRSTDVPKQRTNLPTPAPYRLTRSCESKNSSKTLTVSPRRANCTLSADTTNLVKMDGCNTTTNQYGNSVNTNLAFRTTEIQANLLTPPRQLSQNQVSSPSSPLFSYADLVRGTRLPPLPLDPQIDLRNQSNRDNAEKKKSTNCTDGSGNTNLASKTTEIPANLLTPLQQLQLRQNQVGSLRSPSLSSGGGYQNKNISNRNDRRYTMTHQDMIWKPKK